MVEIYVTARTRIKIDTRASIEDSTSINGIIADLATIIIVYDVTADIFEKLNYLSVPTPRIVLITKQTSEEARFFHLKNLGTSVG